MTKEIKSSSELINFIDSLPLAKEQKDSINILQETLSNIDISKYDSNYIQEITDQMFHNLEKILNDIFEKYESIEYFKKNNNIDRIIISIHERNNTLYATV